MWERGGGHRLERQTRPRGYAPFTLKENGHARVREDRQGRCETKERCESEGEWEAPKRRRLRGHGREETAEWVRGWAPPAGGATKGGVGNPAVGGTEGYRRLWQEGGSWETGLEGAIAPGSVHVVTKNTNLKRETLVNSEELDEQKMKRDVSVSMLKQW